MENITLLDGAEPLFYPGNKVGCLLLHGHGGAPHNLHWMGQYLNQQGYTVYVPRLAGHGTTPDDLARIHRREWVADVLTACRMLRSHCKQLFVLGLSLGGALTLRIAAMEPLDGVVVMAAPHRYSMGWKWPVLHAISLFGGRIPDPVILPERDKSLQRVLAEQQKRGEKQIGRVTYTTKPAWSLIQVVRLLDEMRAGLPSISAPMLFIHSLSDHVVPFWHTERNHDAAGSADKRVMALQSDRHGISEHPDLIGDVFPAAGEFIAAHS